MKKYLFSYQNILLLIALFVLASVVMSKNIRDRGASNVFERTALAISSPLQNIVTNAVRKSVETWEHYIDLTETAQENDRLIKLLDGERYRNLLLTEDLKKYNRIDDMVTKNPMAGARFIVADVIGWDSTNMSQTLVINKGTDNGVVENMVVMNMKGLIGRIVEASGNSSRVLMITDSRSSIDALLQESRDRCIIVGQNKQKCLVRFLALDATAQPGDFVISSGLGGIFPKGLPLGTLSKIEKGSGRLFYTAELLPAAEIKQLEEVLVITRLAGEEKPEEEPEPPKKVADKKGVRKPKQ